MDSVLQPYFCRDIDQVDGDLKEGKVEKLLAQEVAPGFNPS